MEDVSEQEEEPRPRRLEQRIDLATLSSAPVGTRVLVNETGEIFHAVGMTPASIAALLGWDQKNVWLPESARQNMIIKHPEFRDPATAIHLVLNQPLSVHDVPGAPHHIQIFADAEPLRAAENLTSNSVPSVDVLIELRSAGVTNIHYLRVFHLSPMRRARGNQLWP